MRSILVTGGAGFIGYHAAKRLLERGDRVTIADSFNEYYDPSLKVARAKSLLKVYRRLQVHKLDIADYPALERRLQGERFDLVLHLAAQAGVRYAAQDPFAYGRANLDGTLSILEFCRRFAVPRLVYASSSSVYGGNTKLPFKEGDRTDRPLSLYAATKKANEGMVYSYHRLYGLMATGLRFFTVYGPWGRPDMALFKFTKAILSGEAIELYNHGNMARDFTYIDDIVDGVMAAVDRPFPCETFNLARGESRRLAEYVVALEHALGRTADKVLRPIQAGESEATAADIAKARAFLDYRPSVSIEEGVRRFVVWFKEYYNY
jgi:UDP-glucuronate 4-epimerase